MHSNILIPNLITFFPSKSDSIMKRFKTTEQKICKAVFKNFSFPPSVYLLYYSHKTFISSPTHLVRSSQHQANLTPPVCPRIELHSEAIYLEIASSPTGLSLRRLPISNPNSESGLSLWIIDCRPEVSKTTSLGFINCLEQFATFREMLNVY